MKKVLHISTYYFPQYGGIEQVAYDVVDILNEYNIENRVICFSETGITKEEKIDGIKVYKIGYIKKVASQAISFEYYFKLKKIIEEYKPQFIHLHLPNPLIAIYLNIILKNNKNIKLISHWHSDIVKQRIIKKIYKHSQKTTLKNSYKIIATSEEYAKKSEDLREFSEKISIIPNIVNEKKMEITNETILRTKELEKIYFNKKIIFFIGVHREYKGLKFLIDASKYLSNDYKVLIAGSGTQTLELKEYAKNDRKIEFLGKITDEDKIAYLKIADLFAFPSITKNEAFGVALAEALYFGVPAITFKIEGSGVNWVNKDRYTGTEAQVKAPIEYLKAILETEKNKKKYGENAKVWTRKNFTKEAIVDRVINIYK